MLLLDGAKTGLSSSHCCAIKPTKNLSQRVSNLVSMVAVALIPAGTPSEVYRVVIVISGSPTSKGTPRGMDLMANVIVAVISITLQEMENRSDIKIKYGMLKLRIQVIPR